MLDKKKHRIALYRLLTGMLRNPYLTASLGFKGGTACHFFYDLPRFSVDLDFDILPENREKCDCAGVADNIRRVMDAENLSVRDEMVKQNTVLLMASYGTDERNIKVEVSRRDFPNTYAPRDFYGLPVQVMVPADIFAHKLVAATDRGRIAPRDFFDIWYFARQGWDINGELVSLRTGKDLKGYLANLIMVIREKVNGPMLIRDLGELVGEDRKGWVKNGMKQELIGLLEMLR